MTKSDQNEKLRLPEKTTLGQAWQQISTNHWRGQWNLQHKLRKSLQLFLFLFLSDLAIMKVVVAQLAEQLLLTPEMCGLNPEISKFDIKHLFTVNSTVLKIKRENGMAHLKNIWQLLQRIFVLHFTASLSVLCSSYIFSQKNLSDERLNLTDNFLWFAQISRLFIWP